MLAFKDILIFPIVCMSPDYKSNIKLIRKCTDLSFDIFPSNSISSSSAPLPSAILGSNQRRLKKGNFQYYFAPAPLLVKFAFWLIMQSGQGVIMQFSYLKHLFMRHFASLPCVNQLFFHSPQLSTVSVNRSAEQVNQLAL